MQHKAEAKGRPPSLTYCLDSEKESFKQCSEIVSVKHNSGIALVLTPNMPIVSESVKWFHNKD